MTHSHWRKRSKEVISKVIREVSRYDVERLRAAIRAAYPFGQRRYHPYKIWLDEVRMALNPELPAKPNRPRKRKPQPDEISETAPLPGQLTLFE